MKVLKLDTDTNEKNIVAYPRYDMQAISDLPFNIKYYYIEEGDKPSFNSLTHKLELSEELIDGDPIGTYTKSWSIVQLNNTKIISNLSNSLGEHLDSLYPEWERSKHAGESLRFLLKGEDNWDDDDNDRIAYITSIADWAKECRSERDNREKELTNNGTLPSFEWEDRPIKE